MSAKAQELIEQYIKNESLRKHCYAVESVMRFYAKKLGEDEERWGDAGLLHDLDYEMYPDTHPNTAVPILKEAGYDDEFIDVILGHGYPGWSNVPRTTKFAHYLFACDEVTGIVMAYSFMKPDKYATMEVKGVMKKFKDKAFARNVSRDDLILGAEEIDVPLDEHIGNVILAMRDDVRL